MKILFQGDSVTDCGRDRKTDAPNQGLGCGYVNLIASRLLCDNPDWEIVNKGVGGNRIGDMYSRWIEDTLNVDFDILSVMNGINDVGFSLRLNMGASCEEYEFMYDHMLTQVKEIKPDCKIVILEPFIVKLDLKSLNSSNDSGDIFTEWEIWERNMRERCRVSKKLAEKYEAVFIPLFDDFNKLAEKNGAKYWSLDGIHPTLAGHEYIARKWLEYCNDELMKYKLN